MQFFLFILIATLTVFVVHNLNNDNSLFYLPVLMEHAALIMATITEMRKNRRDQLNPIEVIFVVATAAALLFLRSSPPTATACIAAGW